MSEVACFVCGVAQPYGQIRCDFCGEPLVFPKELEMKKPGQFRDITALEVLRDGQTEAMENLGGAALAMAQVAGTIDARFAAIEARLKALEERHTIEGKTEETNERREASVEKHEG